MKCVCEKGWTSENCATPTCRGLGVSGCGSHGTCIAPNTCRCSKGFSGPDCSVIKGSDGKFFFTLEDSKRWAQDEFAVKEEELRNAEHDLKNAQRKAERKASKERHVFHLEDSENVHVKPQSIDSSEERITSITSSASPTQSEKIRSNKNRKHSPTIAKVETAKKVDLREIARRTFPHLSEQELDLLPKDKLFSLESMHIPMPNKFHDTIDRIRKENDHDDLFWTEDDTSDQVIETVKSIETSSVLKTRANSFEEALSQATKQRAEMKKSEDILIDAGASFVEAVVESEEDTSSTWQNSSSSLDAIYAAKKEIEHDLNPEVTIEQVSEKLPSPDESAAKSGLFWGKRGKYSHAQKDIQDLLAGDEVPDDGEIASATWSQSVLDDESSNLMRDTPLYAGGSVIVNKQDRSHKSGRANSIEMKDESLGTFLAKTAEMHQAKFRVESERHYDNVSASSVPAENDNATKSSDDVDMNIQTGLSNAETVQRSTIAKSIRKPKYKKSYEGGLMSQQEKELLAARKKRQAAEAELRKVSNASKEAIKGSSEMIRGSSLLR